MADNKSSTEQVTDSGKKFFKKTIGKSFGFILKIIILITLPLILLVSSLYVIFNAITADQLFAPGWNDWLENDDEINYE